MVFKNFLFSRVSVWALVRRLGGSLKEQVAALLHDASPQALSTAVGLA